MATHPQVWVKVNALVDTGVAEIVSLLNQVPHLRTIDSCQGGPGHLAHVCFYMGDWKQIGEFLFEKLLPELAPAGEDVRLSVEVFNNSEPMGSLRFHPAASALVASAIRRTLQEHS
ncbi:MAG: hypothetical protein ACRD3C_25550 [Vicinamibacterales bacterium]